MKIIKPLKLTSMILIMCFALALAAGCGSDDGSDIDYNLTKYSKTMIHSTVDDMTNPQTGNPLKYIGKTVKVQGKYMPWYVEEVDRWFQYVEIEGDEGCCPQYLEFVVKGDLVYPDDYPPNETLLELTGVFGLYDSDGYNNLPHLSVDEIVIK